MRLRPTPVSILAALLFAVAMACPLALPASAQDKVGIILMHGKQGTSTGTVTGLPDLAQSLRSAGHLVVVPTMPWSAGAWETINVTVEQAYAAIDQHAAELRRQGARRIVVAGQSLGANMALSYAVEKGGVDKGGVAGLVMMAPGHNPAYFYSSNESFKKAVDRAAELTKAGQGSQPFGGPDFNTNSNPTVSTTAAIYFSWMDPRGKASMDVVASRLPASVPLLMVGGEQDPATRRSKRSYYEPAAKNSYSKYITVPADHLTTPAASVKPVTDWINGLPK